MSYLDVLFHPALVMATLLYTVLAISFEILYQNFLHKIQEVSVSHWIAKYIGAPFIHVLLLVAFIYMSYPILFGLESHNALGERVLPTLSELLNAHSGQTMKLINVLFIISVLLPLIPVINRFLALILPLQAIAGSTMLYGWLAENSTLAPAQFPGLHILALMIIFSIIADVFSRSLAKLFGHSLNTQYHTHDMEKVIQKSTLLIFQVPILLLYSLNIQ